MRIEIVILAAAITLGSFLLGACTPHDTGLGENVKHNMAMQVIDPDPQYAGDPIEGASGDRAASALERYRKGTVKEPQTIRTSNGIGGSGGGGSGSGGSR